MFGKYENLSFCNQGGAAMVVALGAVCVLTIFGLGLTTVTTEEYQSVIKERASTKAYFLAEAGIEKAMKELNINRDYQGTISPENLSDGQFEIEVSDSSSESQKIVTSKGYFPSKSNQISTRIIRSIINISAVRVPFDYAIHAGEGGLRLNGATRVIGDAYSNANISNNGSNVIIGNAYAAGTIPPSLNVNGSRAPSAAPMPFPDLDLDYWESEAAAGGTYHDDYTIISTRRSLGPKKIEGSLTVRGGGVLVITGPLWVTENITVSGNGRIEMDSSFGPVGTLVIAGTRGSSSHGRVTTSGTATFKGTGEGGFLLLVSERANTSANGFSLSGSVNAVPDAIFYSNNSQLSINGSVAAAGLNAHQINLSGSADIQYDDRMGSALFSRSPGGGWAIQEGSWRESTQ